MAMACDPSDFKGPVIVHAKHGGSWYGIFQILHFLEFTEKKSLLMRD